MHYDVIVIGGGPGGYVAAIRAAQLGGKVALIEKDSLGGVCLNRGCIPTKTLLYSAERWHDLQHSAEYGLIVEQIGFDFSKVLERKQRVVNQLRDGVTKLVQGNGITVLTGTASLLGAGQVEVAGTEHTQIINAAKIILATGAEPCRLPVPGNQLPQVINSNAALELSSVPPSMAIIGAGAVGVEFAAIYRAFGCEVTLVEMQPAILPNVDGDIVKRMALVLRKQGIKMITGAKVLEIRKEGQQAVVIVETAKGLQELTVTKVLAATGRRPCVDGLNLAAAGVGYSAKGIPVDDRMQTNVSGVYAIGDLTGTHMWAHAASTEALVAADNAMGKIAAMDYRAVPGCIFTMPEIAMVGLTEEEAKKQGIAICVSRFNLAGNGKAMSMGQTDGLVKIISSAEDDKVLGMHILGVHASDLIMEGAIAIQNGLRAADIAHTIHPHPSLSEAVMEAAHGIRGEMIHQLKTSR